jgi:replicative DNA helicase
MEAATMDSEAMDYIEGLRRSIGDGPGFLAREAANVQRPTSTGIRLLDSAVGGGLMPGVSIFGAEPGGGKSVLGLQVAANVAEAGRTSFVFSAEMDRATCRYRLYSMLSDTVEGAPAKFTCSGRSVAEQIARYRKEGEQSPIAWAERQYESRYYLLILFDRSTNPADKGRITPEFIEETVGKAVRAGVRPFVVIDYCQFLTFREARPNALGEYERTSAISRMVAGMAKRYDVPVMMLSQFSRSGTNDPDMHSLRGSGQLEQDARLVATIKPESENQLDARGGRAVTITVHKNRSGIVGAECPLWLYGGYNHFGDRR